MESQDLINIILSHSEELEQTQKQLRMLDEEIDRLALKKVKTNAKAECLINKLNDLLVELKEDYSNAVD